MSELTGIDSAVIDHVWPHVHPHVAACFDKLGEYRYEPEDILDAIRERDMQLWVAIDGNEVKAILITQLVRYPRVMECELFLWSGERTPDWEDHLARIEQWAREQGCHYMSSLSRPGTAKVTNYRKGMIRTYRRL